MQVKKFEASSMKEALELIKNQLGPEAIILSVKDRKLPVTRGGGQIFEVTAAVSETTLKKMHIAQKKLGSKDLERFNRAPARLQKEFINRVFEKPEPKATNIPRPLTSTRYIEIGDEGAAANEVRTSHFVETMETNEAIAKQRIKTAAQSAVAAARSSFVQKSAAPVPETYSAKTVRANANVQAEPKDYLSIKNEIGELKKVIEELQGVRAKQTRLHPGAEHGIDFELSSLFEKLMRTGIEEEWLANTILAAQETLPSGQSKNRSVVEGFVAKKVLETVSIVSNPLATRYHVFVGPSGQGKTSSLVKLASHLVLQQKKRVAIATVDRFKVGASEQLRIFAQILNIPYAEVTSPTDWTIVDKKLGHIDYVLVDFPGASLKSSAEVELLQNLLPPTTGGRAVHLVQSVLSKNEDAYEIAQRYSAMSVKDVIFTKLDESIQHGLMLNLQNKFNWPLFSFGVGPQIPEDFEWASKERVLNLLFRVQNQVSKPATVKELEE